MVYNDSALYEQPCTITFTSSTYEQCLLFAASYYMHNCTRIYTLRTPARPLDVQQQRSSCCGRSRGFPEAETVITRGEDDLSPPPLYPTRVAEVGVVFRATSPHGSGSCPTISTLSGCGAHGVASVGASGLGQALVDLFLARRNRPEEGVDALHQLL